MTAGDKLRKSLDAEAKEHGIAFDQREELLIAEAMATADLIAQLEEAIEEEGVTVHRRGSKVVSHCVREIRLQRLLLQRLLGGLDFSGNTGEDASQQARRAANTRWKARR